VRTQGAGPTGCRAADAWLAGLSLAKAHAPRRTEALRLAQRSQSLAHSPRAARRQRGL